MTILFYKNVKLNIIHIFINDCRYTFFFLLNRKRNIKASKCIKYRLLRILEFNILACRVHINISTKNIAINIMNNKKCAEYVVIYNTYCIYIYLPSNTCSFYFCFLYNTGFWSRHLIVCSLPSFIMSRI